MLVNAQAYDEVFNLSSDSGYTSSIFFDASYHEDGASNFSLSLDQDVQNFGRFHFSIDSASNALLDSDETLNNLSLGWKKTLAAQWTPGVAFEYWGVEDEFEVKDWTPSLNVSNEAWFFSIAAIFRTMTITATNLTGQKISRDTDATAVRAGVGYSGESDIGVALDYTAYDYDLDLRILDPSRSLIARRFLSPTAVGLGFGLEDYRLDATLFFPLKSNYNEIRFAHSVSAVDQEATNTVSVFTAASLTERWDYQLELGIGKSESVDGSSAFLGIGLGYWY